MTRVKFPRSYQGPVEKERERERDREGQRERQIEREREEKNREGRGEEEEKILFRGSWIGLVSSMDLTVYVKRKDPASLKGRSHCKNRAR